MTKHREIPACVIVQTPAYGTISWGPFRNREEAEQFVVDKKHWHELVAAYETPYPSGLVIMVVSLYSTDLPKFECADSE